MKTKNALPDYTPAKTFPDWQGVATLIKRPAGTIIAADPRGPVELIRKGKDNFTVVYGLQTVTDLNYKAAALEYGLCVLHACQCNGL